MNTQGVINGGGVCLNCTVGTYPLFLSRNQRFLLICLYFLKDLTSGINCESCIDWYYRPYGVLPEQPCRPCECHGIGSTGCNPIGGACSCNVGFKGSTCAECADGYEGVHCKKCACDARGTMPGGECESHCQCRVSQINKYVHYGSLKDKQK